MDSTTLPVCKNQRIQSLKQIATRGKSSMGWFYGCKLHVLVDAQGQLIQTQLSNGHTSDIKILPRLAQGYMGKIFRDRGYISEILKDNLGTQGVELMTYHRKNMRPLELSLEDELMLRQRNKIETIFSLLNRQYTTCSAVVIVPFQVISLGFMHPYVLIKSVIKTSLCLQRCKIRLIHDSGSYTKHF